MNMSVQVCTLMSETCMMGWMAVEGETGGSGKEYEPRAWISAPVFTTGAIL